MDNHLPPPKRAAPRVTISMLGPPVVRSSTTTDTFQPGSSTAKSFEHLDVLKEHRDNTPAQKAGYRCFRASRQGWIYLIMWTFIAYGVFCTRSLWQFRSENSDVRYPDTSMREGKFFKLMTRRNLRFLQVSNANFHYVGRWSNTNPGQRKDVSFAGAYLEFIIHNSSSLFLSLYNSGQTSVAVPPSVDWSSGSDLRHLDLRSTKGRHQPAAPVSLVVIIDEHELVVYPATGSGIVEVADGILDASSSHHFRIIYSGYPWDSGGTLQLEGFWISIGGQVSHIHDDGNIRRDDQNVKSLQQNSSIPKLLPRFPRKLLEIITDSSRQLAPNSTSTTTSTEGVLEDLATWDYLVGEMFNADHVTLSVNDLCLAPDCNGSDSSSITISDTFYRSGPPVARTLWTEDGDAHVHWIDTSGWLDKPSSPETEPDAGLTATEHKLVASYLSMHLCPHLAETPNEECEFLGHEAPYVGKVVVPRERELERMLEQSKIEKIKEKFFTGHGKGLKEGSGGKTEL
ncbi:MAG: hypothetical protein Q9160_000401 [Pyrenula sp. 1 TL-2023]